MTPFSFTCLIGFFYIISRFCLRVARLAFLCNGRFTVTVYLFWYYTPISDDIEGMFRIQTWFYFCYLYMTEWVAIQTHRISYFTNNWILSTNHRRIAVMYFTFTMAAGISGLLLATIIRLELSYPGRVLLSGNAEKYLTIVSLHGVIMVFFVVVPILFGAFGNFLLPTQLGIRDVAFPRLNSFMFWVTPAGFVLLLHILLFDKSYNLTYWVNYSELRDQLRRRYTSTGEVDLEFHKLGYDLNINNFTLNMSGVDFFKTTDNIELILNKCNYNSTIFGIQKSFFNREWLQNFIDACDFRVVLSKDWNCQETLIDLADQIYLIIIILCNIWYGFWELVDYSYDLAWDWIDSFSHDVGEFIFVVIFVVVTSIFDFSYIREVVDFWIVYYIGYIYKPASNFSEYDDLVRDTTCIDLSAKKLLTFSETKWDYKDAFEKEKKEDDDWLGLNDMLDLSWLKELILSYLSNFGFVSSLHNFDNVAKKNSSYRASFENTFNSNLSICRRMTNMYINGFYFFDIRSLHPKHILQKEYSFWTVDKVFFYYFYLLLNPEFIINFILKKVNNIKNRVVLRIQNILFYPFRKVYAIAWFLYQRFDEHMDWVVAASNAWCVGETYVPREKKKYIQYCPTCPIGKELVKAWWKKFAPSYYYDRTTDMYVVKVVFYRARLLVIAQDFLNILEPIRYYDLSWSAEAKLDLQLRYFRKFRRVLKNIDNLFNIYSATLEYSRSFIYSFNFFKNCSYIVRITSYHYLPVETLWLARISWFNHLVSANHLYTSFFISCYQYEKIDKRINLHNTIFTPFVRSFMSFSTFNISYLTIRLPFFITLRGFTTYSEIIRESLLNDWLAGAFKIVPEILYWYPVDYIIPYYYAFSETSSCSYAEYIKRFFIFKINLYNIMYFNYFQKIDVIRTGCSLGQFSIFLSLANPFNFVRESLEDILDSILDFLISPVFDQELMNIFYLWVSPRKILVNWENLCNMSANKFKRSFLPNFVHKENLDKYVINYRKLIAVNYDFIRDLRPFENLWNTYLVIYRLWPYFLSKFNDNFNIMANRNACRISKSSDGSFSIVDCSIEKLQYILNKLIGDEIWVYFSFVRNLKNLKYFDFISSENYMSRILFFYNVEDLSNRYLVLLFQKYKEVDLTYLNDWRCIKFEREVWRSIDDLSMARKHWLLRTKYYSNFYEPASLVNKVSIWMPNHLIPGWAFITPYTSRLKFTALGKVDVALIVVLVASLGSVFSSINYVITYRYIGAPIFKNRKELRSFFVDALLVASRMMIVANPALVIGIILLLSDRHFGTSVFDFSGGGDTILFQHLFWFFGHPEVYIVIIPCFGIMNSLLPYYLRKRLSGRLSLQFSMYTIAFMAFAVWGHHMYMVGLANSVRTMYSTGTVMISVPASTKILHWCVTIIQSSLSCDVGFLYLLAFMYFFVLGGLSGMFVAHLGFDVLFHDTFFVVGHFHVMFACATMCCIFAAFYFYFPSIFGVRYSRFFAYLQFVFFTFGQLITIIPMIWLGYSGMPRRVMDYPSAFAGWHSIISSGHLLIVISFIFFFCMIFDSLYEGRAPVSKTKGVSRLNTRLAFYVYEIRKIKYSRSKSLILPKLVKKRKDELSVYKLGYEAELVNFTYIFKK